MATEMMVSIVNDDDEEVDTRAAVCDSCLHTITDEIICEICCTTFCEICFSDHLEDSPECREHYGAD